MKFESFNFTQEFQEAILACLIRYPEKFNEFGQLIKPAFFEGPSESDMVFHMLEFQKKYGKYPTFSTLANYAYHKLQRVNADRAKEVVDFVEKLAETDTSDWQAVLDLAKDFARERAVYDALREIHGAQTEGKLHKVDPRDIIDRALTVGTGLLPESGDALLAADIPDAEPVIESLLDRGMVGLFGAASKSHKTWANLQLACAVGHTGDWLGFHCRKGRVLYLNFELTRKAMQTRLRAVFDKLRIKEPLNIDFMQMKGINFDPVSLLQTLANTCKKEKYALVILDPLYVFEQAAGKSGNDPENSNYAMGQVMLRFITLATQANCAVWVCHHFGKGNQASKDMLDRFVGGGVIGRALDSAVTMTKHKASDTTTGERVYSLEFETRNHREVEPFVARWQYPLLVEDTTLDPADLAQPKKAVTEPKYRTESLLEHFEDEITTTAHFERVTKQTGMSRATFNRLRGQLIDSGKLLEKGGKWYLAEK